MLHRALQSLLPLFLVGLLAAPADAHQQLVGSRPAAGAVADVVPRQLRLEFAEPVQLTFTRIELFGPGGAAVALAQAELHPDSPNVLVVPIRGVLRPGGYTVRWLTASSDGHPVRGEYTFAIAEGAEGLTRDTAGIGTGEQADAADAPVGSDATPGAAGPPPAAAFDADSPAYVATRWMSYIALLGVIGTVTFSLLVLGRVSRRRLPDDSELILSSRRIASGVGLVFIVLLAISTAGRLYAQSLAMHGPAAVLDGQRIGTMLVGTVWGWGWILQAAAALLAGVGLVLARRRASGGWVLAAVGAVILSVTPAFSGHAAAMSGTVGALAIGLDALHVLAAGGWLGSLLVLLVAGIPAALRLGAARRGLAVAALVRAFSPTALMFAALLILTGIGTTLIHSSSLSALLASRYGTVLLVKLGIFLLLFLSGAYNYLRVQPALGGDAGTSRLRRTAGFEVALAAVVLLVTSLLVATERPSQEVGTSVAQSRVGSSIETPD